VIPNRCCDTPLIVQLLRRRRPRTGSSLQHGSIFGIAATLLWACDTYTPDLLEGIRTDPLDSETNTTEPDNEPPPATGSSPSTPSTPATPSMVPVVDPEPNPGPVGSGGGGNSGSAGAQGGAGNAGAGTGSGGTGANIIAVKLPTAATQADSDHFGFHSVPLTDQWQQFLIPFDHAMLVQQGFGAAQVFDPAELISIQFSLAPGSTGFDVWIDDVMFAE
jgi:hypothetical protein